FIQTYLPEFLVGARNTLIYCVSAFPLALLFGLILALMRSSRILWLRGPARIFIEVIRGTPIFAQLFILYYAIGSILLNYCLESLDNEWSAGIAVLAINYAAYESDVFRDGVLFIDRGQSE